jgi:hypothetical protein
MENPPKIRERVWLAVLVGGGTGSGKAFGRLFTTNVCLYLAREMDKLGPDASAAGKVGIRFCVPPR